MRVVSKGKKKHTTDCEGHIRVTGQREEDEEEVNEGHY